MKKLVVMLLIIVSVFAIAVPAMAASINAIPGTKNPGPNSALTVAIMYRSAFPPRCNPAILFVFFLMSITRSVLSFWNATRLNFRTPGITTEHCPTSLIATRRGYAFALMAMRLIPERLR